MPDAPATSSPGIARLYAVAVGENKAAAQGDPATAPEGPRRWVRASLDNVPTKWLASVGIGVFLAATAAFGGLEAVADPKPPEVAPGEQVLTPNLDMTVQRVFVSDRVEGGASADADSGERVLAVQLEVTSLSDEYRLVRGAPGFYSTRIVDGPDKAPDASRPGESANRALILQPGVTDVIILSWTVDAGDYREGDEVRISLSNPQLNQWQFLDKEWHWADGGVSAFVTATLDDLGEGDPW